VTLRLWPAGRGRIDAVPEGGAAVSCDFATTLASTTACEVKVQRGTRVTLTATAEPDAQTPSQFVRWTSFGCKGTGPCTITVDEDGDWVAAIFTPLRLEVGINGAGTVSVESPSGGVLDCADAVGFGDHTCSGQFAAEQQVVLVAKPTNATDAIRWRPGCDAQGARCTVAMTNIRTFASVAFGEQPDGPPFFPFQITARIRVVRAGTGTGTVSGSGKDINDNAWSIDCGDRNPSGCARSGRWRSASHHGRDRGARRAARPNRPRPTGARSGS
jgi:hypothetical protein